MSEYDWDAGGVSACAMFLNGAALTDVDARGHPIVDDTFLVCFNGSWETIRFATPPMEYGRSWTVVLDTVSGDIDEGGVPGRPAIGDSEAIVLEARSMLLMRSVDTATRWRAFAAARSAGIATSAGAAWARRRPGPAARGRDTDPVRPGVRPLDPRDAVAGVHLRPRLPTGIGAARTPGRAG